MPNFYLFITWPVASPFSTQTLKWICACAIMFLVTPERPLTLLLPNSYMYVCISTPNAQVKPLVGNTKQAWEEYCAIFVAFASMLRCVPFATLATVAPDTRWHQRGSSACPKSVSVPLWDNLAVRSGTHLHPGTQFHTGEHLQLGTRLISTQICLSHPNPGTHYNTSP